MMLCVIRILFLRPNSLLESVTGQAQHRSALFKPRALDVKHNNASVQPRSGAARSWRARATGRKIFSREIGCMAAPQPGIGDWYRQKEGGALFEVVAFDDDDGTIEIQYFDGTVEEMDVEDWEGQWDDGALESAEPPEDWTGSVDVESEDDGR